jgi:hypothetical protein
MKKINKSKVKKNIKKEAKIITEVGFAEQALSEIYEAKLLLKNPDMDNKTAKELIEAIQTSIKWTIETAGKFEKHNNNLAKLELEKMIKFLKEERRFIESVVRASKAQNHDQHTRS